ncbi:hypothetical protein [Spirillospora sp. NPDC047279]|uniref:hypothetical protein n=1 Tax=Spirillospora sp. NPDC047279 TaxID=3155478 RepID=UPI0033CAE756
MGATGGTARRGRGRRAVALGAGSLTAGSLAAGLLLAGAAPALSARGLPDPVTAPSLDIPTPPPGLSSDPVPAPAATPAAPGTPGAPGTSGAPGVPGTPGVQGVPGTNGMPWVPAAPEQQATPVAPWTPPTVLRPAEAGDEVFLAMDQGTFLGALGVFLGVQATLLWLGTILYVRRRTAPDRDR